MDEQGDQPGRFTAHHDALVEGVVEHRNAVLDPSREFDHRNYAVYLRDTLVPHTSREEAVLYSRVDEQVGSEFATAGLRADHDELERRIDALASEEIDGAQLPLELHEFTAILQQHHGKETDVLLPFLRKSMDREAFESLLASMRPDRDRE